MLVDGKWSSTWHPYQSTSSTGTFQRQLSSFRHWVTPDGSPGPTGSGGFPAAPQRYRLYVAFICPWASRTLLARALKGLQDVVPVTIVEPFLTDQGWRFGDYPGATRDPVLGAEYVHQLYTAADGKFTGRATVPVLWDTEKATIVSNESADIVRMLNSAFDGLPGIEKGLDLYPESRRAEIDAINDEMYDALNNGVYKSGFAKSQEAYEEAVGGVFAQLNTMEQRMSDGREFLLGDTLTESDLRLFVTLIRFDAAYHGLFKCNIKQLTDYPHLVGYVKRMMRVPGVKGTVNMSHIKTGYYSIKALNPSQIVPVGPDESWLSVEE